jgi:hypothetical protein
MVNSFVVLCYGVVLSLAPRVFLVNGSARILNLLTLFFESLLISRESLLSRGRTPVCAM